MLRPVLLATLTTLFPTGCASEAPDSMAPVTMAPATMVLQEPDAITCPEPEERSDSEIIGTEGGAVAAGTACLLIGPGALPEATQITLEVEDDRSVLPPLPAGFGYSYPLVTKGISISPVNPPFMLPVELTVGDGQAASALLMLDDEDSLTWQPVQGVETNYSSSIGSVTLTAQLTRGGIYLSAREE